MRGRLSARFFCCKMTDLKTGLKKESEKDLKKINPAVDD